MHIQNPEASRRVRLRLFDRQLDRRAMFSVGALVLACALGLGSVTISQPQVGAHMAATVTRVERLQIAPKAEQAGPTGGPGVAKADILRPADLARAAADQAAQAGAKQPTQDSQASLAPASAVPSRSFNDPSHVRDQTSITAAAQPASTLKAVVIVGPSGEQTSNNLLSAEEFADLAESYGMDVRRVFHPNATWANVLANVQGANLVAYFGHGNSWPSPYGPFQERTKDGFGLDRREGASADQVTYYGADAIRREIVLAPNAIVTLNHLCYASGNAEPGMAIPDWETAWQRVDNYASGFLSVGARAVFAYGTGSINPIIDGLFTTDQTMDEIFMTRGAHRQPYYGFTGWDDRYLDSARTPGLRNHLDPGASEGFLRAISGELTMTTRAWMTGSQAATASVAVKSTPSAGVASPH